MTFPKPFWLLAGVTAIILLFGNSALRASHAAGGEIFYEYIGDSTGVSHQYLVTLTLYRREQGIGFGTTAVLNVNSSCYSSQSYTLSAGPNQNSPLLYFGECTDSLAGNPAFASIIVNYYEYSGVVTLPGVCSDFRFSYDICCRNGNITNLATFPAIYLESTLNNTLGPNNSPEILSEGSKAFCIGRTVNWRQTASEADGDSLYYELIQPLSDFNTPISWAPGYSTSQPITTSNGVNLNSNTGDFVFTPIQSEVAVVRFRISEYRADTVLGVFYKIGHVDRDVQVYIINNCPANPSQLLFSTLDSLSADTARIDCGMKKVQVNFSGRIDCRTIAADGSDFAVFNSYGNLIPVIAAGSDSCSANITSSLWIEFYDSIYYNDDIYLVIRTGSDLNTIESICGASLTEGDSLPLKITDCASSIGIPEFEEQHWQFYPNPAGDQLNIITTKSDQAQYEILNMSGQLMLSGSMANTSVLIDVSPLPTGVYLLRIMNASFTETRKFIKQ